MSVFTGYVLVQDGLVLFPPFEVARDSQLNQVTKNLNFDFRARPGPAHDGWGHDLYRWRGRHRGRLVRPLVH